MSMFICMFVIINLSSMVVIVTTSLLIGSLSSSDTFGGGSWGHTRLLDWPRRDWICWKACSQPHQAVTWRQPKATYFSYFFISSLRKAVEGVHACSIWISQGTIDLYVSNCLVIEVLLELYLYQNVCVCKLISDSVCSGYLISNFTERNVQ